MESKSGNLQYFTVLVLVNLMWAFQFSGAKIATERLGPFTVTLLPLALSTLILVPWAILGKRRRSTIAGHSITRTVLSFLLLGILGTIASQLGLTWGVQKSLASNAAVLTLTIPVLTALLASLLLGEKMTRLRWLSFGLAIVGVLMVSDIDWHSVDISSGKYLAGNLLIFASCMGSAFINSYSKKLLERFSAAEVLVYSFLVADIILVILAVAYESNSFPLIFSLGWPVWGSLLAIAVFSLSLSMMLFFWVIGRIEVTQASLSIYLLPVLGVVISTVTLKERISWQLVTGAVLVFVSTFLITTIEERRKTEAITSA